MMRLRIWGTPKEVYTRFVSRAGTLRARALFGVLLVLFASVPIALLINRSQADASTCACTVFGTPSGQSQFNNGSPLEVGFKFIPSVNGTISGVRFYKQGSIGGTHTGNLWTSGGSSLATAVFTGETASGWQDVTFSSPVAVTAGTTYVASVTMGNGFYIATSGGLTSDVINGPLTAPSSASSGGNGVFDASPGVFPTSSFGASNYWIDVSFFDTTAPTATAVTPTNGTIGVLPGESLTATFDHNMAASTLNSSTFTVKDSLGTPVPGTVTYDDTARTAEFIANEGFTPNTTYNATLEGGTGTVVKNRGGVALAADYNWTFTAATTKQCPCSFKDRAAPEGSGSFDDTDPGGVELGVKIKASTNGYITAMRFYKPITATETTNIGNIWDSAGTKLATVTFTNESEYGWQEAKMATPLRVHKNQLYILSYGTTQAIYQATGSGLASSMASGYLTAYFDTSVENAATGSGNRNGAFATNANTFPNIGSPNASYYWVDAVFSVESTPANPLAVDVTQPTNGTYGAPRDQAITAKLNRQLDGSTVTNTSYRLFDSSNNPVSGVASYDNALGQAIFTPGSPLAYGQKYTAKLAASIADQNGVTLGSEYTWSFTVGTQVSTNPNIGPGGPLLVITTAGNKYSPYYAEILRTEGLNYFDVKDIGTVDAATLNNYKAAVLAETTLTQGQADMLTNWVTAGGNLVAMRPDAKLASLLGITAAGTTRTNQYMLINTATAPGAGLVNETIQFKGIADNYALSGATSVAALYSDASTATANPAVTSRTVGSNGGTAVAFTYDLAKSVVAQHQGNQAWAGQNRDNQSPVRPNDLFFGNLAGDVQPDWVDLNKIHIPQADEQQRLLANTLINATKDKLPLPRFWYLPGDTKAALVMAGDDHGQNNATGSEMVINNWLNDSATTCSVADWQCVRASHYVYTSSPFTSARATQYKDLNFEIGDHVGTTCGNFISYATLTTEYNNDLAAWRAKYTGIPNQVSHRYHCYVWSDWDTQARVDTDNGIRYDLNYMAYPASWLGSRSPIITGSGMNMRLTDVDGDMMDVRQGVTNFDDQVSTITNINATLDNAIGSTGYYGIFGTHYDMSNVYDKTLYAAAKAHNVPMISSKQALTWLDGHGSSTFSNLAGVNGQFTFTINTAIGANQLRAMMPIQDAAGTLTSLKLAGAPVTYQTQAVKGVQYAVFDAVPGNYAVGYDDYDPDFGTTPPASSGGTGGGSGSTGSGTTVVPKKKIATTPATGETPAETVPGDTTEQPTDDEGQATTTTHKPTHQAETTKKTSGWWLWLWLGLAMIVLLTLLWLLLAWRRRHQHTDPPVTIYP
jgi:hypothetical protein